MYRRSQALLRRCDRGFALVASLHHWPQQFSHAGGSRYPLMLMSSNQLSAEQVIDTALTYQPLELDGGNINEQIPNGGDQNDNQVVYFLDSDAVFFPACGQVAASTLRSPAHVCRIRGVRATAVRMPATRPTSGIRSPFNKLIRYKTFMHRHDIP